MCQQIHMHRRGRVHRRALRQGMRSLQAGDLRSARGGLQSMLALALRHALAVRSRLRSGDPAVFARSRLVGPPHSAGSREWSLGPSHRLAGSAFEVPAGLGDHQCVPRGVARGRQGVLQAGRRRLHGSWLKPWSCLLGRRANRGIGTWLSLVVACRPRVGDCSVGPDFLPGPPLLEKVVRQRSYQFAPRTCCEDGSVGGFSRVHLVRELGLSHFLKLRARDLHVCPIA
mmetsp:Transcript_11244/g.27968  ORF Transcript_11244/g.27968 Transcript_11244/m.27968 type:complete len:228 (+) Transcript_11244:1104-1787(+)